MRAEDASALLALAGQARQAASPEELAFLAVNDSLQLRPYRQAGLWLEDGGVQALSGVVQPEANAPYVQFLTRLCASGAAQSDADAAAGARPLDAQTLGARADLGTGAAAELAREWADWLPAHGLWLPLLQGRAGLLLVREAAWSAEDAALLEEWGAIWTHAWLALQARSRPRRGLGRLLHGLLGGGHSPLPAADTAAAAPGPGGAARSRPGGWRRSPWRWLLALVVIGLIPVRLSVLAPGELVPARPTVVRAPLEGVLGSIQVKPNQEVKAGQPLFRYDDAALQARLEVARQALAGAEAEYRQAAQLAVSDPRYKAQLAPLMGKVEERRAEAEYLQGQLERAHVLAPEDGIVLFDDPSEWVGRPVATGERIMRLARAGDVELEAWLDLGDAIALPEQAPVRLYLNASPLQAIEARLRYMAFEAVQRPDGHYAYRVRAQLEQPTEHRVGLKGTAKLSGERVPLAYWVLRRPLAVMRQLLGW